MNARRKGLVYLAAVIVPWAAIIGGVMLVI